METEGAVALRTEVGQMTRRASAVGGDAVGESDAVEIADEGGNARNECGGGGRGQARPPRRHRVGLAAPDDVGPLGVLAQQARRIRTVSSSESVEQGESCFIEDGRRRVGEYGLLGGEIASECPRDVGDRAEFRGAGASGGIPVLDERGTLSTERELAVAALDIGETAAKRVARFGEGEAGGGLVLAKSCDQGVTSTISCLEIVSQGLDRRTGVAQACIYLGGGRTELAQALLQLGSLRGVVDAGQQSPREEHAIGCQTRGRTRGLEGRRESAELFGVGRARRDVAE
ncbi:hypothetical protein [Microbacterium enclense]|uniref:hypothetical protein n=1 Tax=Microbacterium enclense TaxID=993073 RepID=UPI003F81528D